MYVYSEINTYSIQLYDTYNIFAVEYFPSIMFTYI